MTDTVMTTAHEPDGAPRVASLDVMRAIAILGILFMNINDMGASLYASFGDVRHIGWQWYDQVAWFLRAVLADGTARCLLEMLFGVGMVILTERAAGAVARSGEGGRLRKVAGWLFGPWAVLKGYYWRNLVLFAFGVVHVLVLLWPGDILHSYGLAALVAFLFRRLGPKTLVAIGLLMAVLQLGGGGYSYLTVPAKRAEAARLEQVKAAGGKLSKEQATLVKEVQDGRKRRADARAAETKQVAAEDKARTGTFASWAEAQWRGAWYFQSKGIEVFVLWEAVSVMLIGAALFKWGVIQGERSQRFYVGLLLIGYGVGFTARALGAMTEMRFDDSPSITWAMYEPARLATTLGHIALIHLLLKSVAGARLLRPFEAAGRTALSVYIGQTLICLWLLYPPFALGLYGKQGWLALMLTAAAVNLLLLVWANWWVRRYRIAPVEWAWRSIVAGRRLPFRS
ncbi:MAG: DUF418 domain-containing protein [Pseudomonadota bacterium]